MMKVILEQRYGYQKFTEKGQFAKLMEQFYPDTMPSRKLIFESQTHIFGQI